MEDINEKQKEYKVELEIFEGPLDLLLYLIRKNEIDVSNIPIEKITGQYLEYMDLMRILDLNIASEFLVMAATLMYIKSKMLLPPEERPIEEDVEEDPRLDLVRQLLEYKRYKDVAQYLHQKESLEEQIFTRHTAPELVGDATIVDVSIFDLIGAFKQALSKVDDEVLHEVESENYTVADKIKQIKGLLIQEKSFSVTKIFENMKSKMEVVTTFLALLELIRLKIARAVQKNSFGYIMVETGSSFTEEAVVS